MSRAFSAPGFRGHRTFLAPMEGVTHPVMRALLAERGGLEVVCTEFVRITSTPLSKKLLARHVEAPPAGPDGLPVSLSVQIMGNDLTNMADAAQMVSHAGADVVDVNLGCPAPKAVRKGVGSAMLRDLPLLRRVLTAMRERTDLPLSAKIRAGFDDAGRVLDIARTVEDSGVDFLTVHPRRRSDFYAGVADWRIIGHLKRSLSIPVVGNGDVWYAADALRMRRETGCDAVMIGRPALRNPWIFTQIAALEAGLEPHRPSGDDLYEHFECLAERFATTFRPRSVLTQIKESVRYLGRAAPDSTEFTRALFRAQTTGELLSAARDRLEGRAPEELDLGPVGIREQSGRATLVENDSPETENPVDLGYALSREPRRLTESVA